MTSLKSIIVFAVVAVISSGAMYVPPVRLPSFSGSFGADSNFGLSSELGGGSAGVLRQPPARPVGLAVLKPVSPAKPQKPTIGQGSSSPVSVQTGFNIGAHGSIHTGGVQSSTQGSVSTTSGRPTSEGTSTVKTSEATSVSTVQPATTTTTTKIPDPVVVTSSSPPAKTSENQDLAISQSSSAPEVTTTSETPTQTTAQSDTTSQGGSSTAASSSSSGPSLGAVLGSAISSSGSGAANAITNFAQDKVELNNGVQSAMSQIQNAILDGSLSVLQNKGNSLTLGAQDAGSALGKLVSQFQNLGTNALISGGGKAGSSSSSSSRPSFKLPSLVPVPYGN